MWVLLLPDEPKVSRTESVLTRSIMTVLNIEEIGQGLSALFI